MSDEASDTIGGATKNFLGAVAFTVVLVGGEELGRKILTGTSTAPWWLSACLVGAGYPIYVLPAIWKWLCVRRRVDVSTGRDFRSLPTTARIARPLDQKASVQDAMMYVILKRWPDQNDRLTEEGDNTALNALDALREAANQDRMGIWGIEHNGQLPVRISADFWVMNQIDYIKAVFSDDLESICTQSATAMPTRRKFKGLKVVKAEVEAIWPPVPDTVSQTSSGTVASLSKVVTRAPQFMRDAARIAFETIQGTESERKISLLNPSPEQRLGYFMNDMAAQELRHWGKRPPSSVSMEIPLAERLKLREADGENTLNAMFDDGPAYVDVTVDGDDLRQYLDKLKSRFP